MSGRDDPRESDVLEAKREPDRAFIERLRQSVLEHRRILNWLEPHLPCVVCRGELIYGRCPECDPEC